MNANDLAVALILVAVILTFTLLFPKNKAAQKERRKATERGKRSLARRGQSEAMDRSAAPKQERMAGLLDWAWRVLASSRPCRSGGILE